MRRTMQTRRAVAAAVGGLLATAALTIVTSPPTGAADVGSAGPTRFEIDGNTVVDDTGDWQSTAAEYPSLRDNISQLETCNDNPVELEDGTVITDEPTRVTSGTKLDGTSTITPPTIQAGNVPRKTDLCRVWRAWELVHVPDDPMDPTAGGQYQFVLYLGWSRPATNGEIDVLIPLLGSDPASVTDDFIVSYDFEDSTGTTNVEVLAWNGSAWAPITLAQPIDAVTTEGDVTDPALPDQELTFGEFALNLTLNGLLPEEGPCATFTTGTVFTRTGNSPSANLEDALTMPPLALTNCGSLTVTKNAMGGVGAGATFGYAVREQDGAVLQFPDTTVIDGQLDVPSAPSDTILNLNISPDYVVEETQFPSRLWSEESVVCTATDPLTGVVGTYTLFTTADADTDPFFPIGPGSTATCTITNIGPPGVNVTKSVDPASNTSWSFDFSISPLPEGETNPKTATAANPTVGWSGLQAGTSYTVTEAGATGFGLAGIDCGNGSGTFTATRGQTVTCTAVNRQLATLSVTKSVTNAVAGEAWSFDFTISPVPAGETATKSATSSAATVTWSGLQPGTAYTVTESASSNPRFATGTLTCGAASAPGATGLSVTPTAGQAVTCSATNDRLNADVQIVKSVNRPVALAGDSLVYTLTVTNNGPAPADQVVVSDPLPAGLTLVSATSSQFSCTTAGNTATCTKATMAVGETGTITLNASVGLSVAVGSSLTNVATVSTLTSDPVPSNNTDNSLVAIAPLPATGGSTWPTTVLGLAVLAGGLALLTMSRSRRQV